MNGPFDHVENLRRKSDGGEKISVERRRAALKKFRRVLAENRDAIVEALRGDLGKPAFETLSGELLPLLGIVGYLAKKLPKLTARRKCRVSPINFPARGFLLPEPFGTVLVAATWNYPLLLSLEPLAGAYAAGNRVVLKLSSRSPRTMALVRTLVESVFGEDEIAVVGADVHLEELLKEKFDFIFLTGSASAGKLVLRHAAENCTPAALELGGKCPCIVDASADLVRAARRIVWGKFSNAGQTCVAPDYLLVEESVREKFVQLLVKEARRMYGTDPLGNPDFGRIVTPESYERLSCFVSRGRLLVGGEKDPGALRIAPTIVDQVDPEDPMLKEEIFGPVLPLVTFASPEALSEMLPKTPKPLALYYFGSDKKRMDDLLDSTRSGAVVFNDVVTHFLNFNFPFGGVGESGMGAYHGKYTFELFTHLKPVMKRSRFFDFSFRYPPYGKLRTALLKLLVR